MLLSRDIFKYWVVDRSQRKITILCQDGRELTEELPEDSDILGSQIDVTIFDWERWWITSQTNRGHLIVAEVYSPSTEDPLHGRPSVYLDQNHWSTLAQAIFDRSQIKHPAERDAADELIHLAQDGGVVLPMSSGNVRETANLYGDHRYKVGASLASLSGGWQLRHPLAVWRAELMRVLAQRHGVEVPTAATLPVVTLEPHALLDDDVQAHAMEPDDPQLFILAMSNPSVLLELLVEPGKAERIDPHAWVTSNQEFAEHLASGPYTKPQKEQAAYARAWTENGSLVSAALRELGLAVEENAMKPKEIQKLFAHMPALGAFTKLMVMRQINVSHKWRPNDLTDLIFLSCAAGYVDYVAAEKHTGTQLRQLKRSMPHGTDTSNVHTSLGSLVEKIRSDGVTTESERPDEKQAARHATGS
ncbi:hypothetical protein ACLKOZ_03680 [Arthrobacter sp. R4]|uniref:hypothetical protein n=1 Tax=Arthrobacter sp. R4 TaxID=644417 RepID=UPI003ED9B322